MSALTATGSTRAWRALRDAILERDGWQCRHCGSHVHPRCLVNGCPTCAHVDHLTPRSIGGSDSPDNLVVACQRCNLKRGSRTRPAPARTTANSRAW